MNKVPSWWDSRVTIYNKYEDSSTGIIKWYRTVQSNCFWKNVYSLVNSNSVEIETDNITCRIPTSSKFMEKLKWNEREDKSSRFTLAPGDIIVLGKVDDEIDEYTKGKRSSDLLIKYGYKGCMTIKNVTVNNYSGSSLSHYHVVGV